MPRVIRPIPHDAAIALSGGRDSMFALNYFMRSRRRPIAAYFDHGTEHGAIAREFVSDYCSKVHVPLIVERLASSRVRSRGQSWEQWWSIERHAWFASLGRTVV